MNFIDFIVNEKFPCNRKILQGDFSGYKYELFASELHVYLIFNLKTTITSCPRLINLNKPSVSDKLDGIGFGFSLMVTINTVVSMVSPLFSNNKFGDLNHISISDIFSFSGFDKNALKSIAV